MDGRADAEIGEELLKFANYESSTRVFLLLKLCLTRCFVVLQDCITRLLFL